MDGDNKNTNNNLKTILDDSLDLSLNQIRRLLSNMSPSEIAHALESSPPKQRNILFSLLKTEEEGDVLFELGEEIQQDLISNISNEELAIPPEKNVEKFSWKNEEDLKIVTDEVQMSTEEMDMMRNKLEGLL